MTFRPRVLTHRVAPAEYLGGDPHGVADGSRPVELLDDAVKPTGGQQGRAAI